MSDMIWHESVPLCPHIIGYFRNDIPPEEHQSLTGECEECGAVTTTAPGPRIERPGFGVRAAVGGEPVYDVVEDAIWQALDSEQAMPHSGVDPAYVIPEFLRLLDAAGYTITPIDRM